MSYGYSGPNLASIGMGSWVESIAWDAALRPQTITSPAGTFTYGFNGAGRQLASLQMPGSTTAFGYTGLATSRDRSHQAAAKAGGLPRLRV